MKWEEALSQKISSRLDEKRSERRKRKIWRASRDGNRQAPRRTDMESIILEEEFQEHKFLRLGPYSPILSPIKTIWSMVKSFVKRNLGSNLQTLFENSQDNLPIVEFRSRNLEALLKESLRAIDVSCCVGCISGVLRYFSSALSLEDISFWLKYFRVNGLQKHLVLRIEILNVRL